MEKYITWNIACLTNLRRKIHTYLETNIAQRSFLISYYSFATLPAAARALRAYRNIISIITKLLKGSGRGIPNKRLSIHLRAILPVHDLTVAAGRPLVVVYARLRFCPLLPDAPACVLHACTHNRDVETQRKVTLRAPRSMRRDPHTARLWWLTTKRLIADHSDSFRGQIRQHRVFTWMSKLEAAPRRSVARSAKLGTIATS